MVCTYCSKSPTKKKVSKFLHYHLKPTIQSTKRYIKDTLDSLRKFNNFRKLRENAVLVTVDVAGLYSTIAHANELKAVLARVEEGEDKNIASEDLLSRGCLNSVYKILF